MKKNNSGWLSGAAVAVIVAIIGIWVWGGDSASVPADSAGQATTTSALAPTNNGTPVAVVTKKDTSVASVVKGLSEGSDFYAYFVNSGVAASLTGKGPYTVFVPSNTSVESLPKGTISGLSSADLKRLVQYHVVSGRLLDVDAVYSGTIEALSKDMLNLNVNLTTSQVWVNSSMAVTAYKASNGIVYVINGVLIPPQKGRI